MPTRRPPAEDPEELVRRAELEFRLETLRLALNFVRHTYGTNGDREVRAAITRFLLTQTLKAAETEAASAEQGEMREAMRRVEDALRPKKA